MATIRSLPAELLGMILEFVLRHHSSAGPVNPYAPLLQPGLRSCTPSQSSRNSQCLLANHAFYIAGMHVLWHCVSVATYADLRIIAALAERGSEAGSWARSATRDIALSTTELKIHIRGPYNPAFIPQLCRRMKNLGTLVFGNKGNAPGTGSVHAFILHGITQHCRTLQNLQFQTMSEAPTLCQLAAISEKLQHLRTLHIAWILNSPATDLATVTFSFPRLTTLSLGPITMKECDFTDDSHFVLNDFLGLIDSTVMPQIRDLTILARLDNLALFTQSCGVQLCRLTIRLGNRAAARPRHVIEDCSNLRHVVLILDKKMFPIPEGHPSLEAIDLVYPKGRDEEMSTEIRNDVECFCDRLRHSVNEGKYPSLRIVRFMFLGGTVAGLPAVEWIQRQAFLLAKGNVSLQVAYGEPEVDPPSRICAIT